MAIKLGLIQWLSETLYFYVGNYSKAKQITVTNFFFFKKTKTLHSSILKTPVCCFQQQNDFHFIQQLLGLPVLKQTTHASSCEVGLQA